MCGLATGESEVVGSIAAEAGGNIAGVVEAVGTVGTGVDTVAVAAGSIRVVAGSIAGAAAM